MVLPTGFKRNPIFEPHQALETKDGLQELACEQKGDHELVIDVPRYFGDRDEVT